MDTLREYKAPRMMSSTTGLTVVTCSRRITVKLKKKTHKKNPHSIRVFCSNIAHSINADNSAAHGSICLEFSTNFKFMLGLRHSMLKQAKLFIECETIHSPLI